MYCGKTILILLFGCLLLPAEEFSGTLALEQTRKVVEFGPRPPGSKAHTRMQEHIRSQLKQWDCEIIEDRFTAKTPRGPIQMNNIIARFAGTSERAVVISGHYDTKWLPKIRFVGANDAGSSTGLLLELARALSGQERKHDVYLVWFDGEEAFGQWSNEDGVYGSRHLARQWADEGLLSRIVGLINVDMIGDKQLGVLAEYYSTRSLYRLVQQTAEELGYEEHFLREQGAIEDDHVPFLKLGVTAVNLIDFEFGPGNEYWHTEEDTMDKLSAESLEVVGQVVLGVIKKLEAQD